MGRAPEKAAAGEPDRYAVRIGGARGKGKKMQRQTDLLKGLRRLLAGFNVAVFCLAIGVIDMFPKNGWSVQSDGPPDFITIWFASHHADGLPWVILASLSISAGVYAFGCCLLPAQTSTEASQHTQAEGEVRGL